ncbi:MAG: SWIM zinc finger family protein [Planctomycetota bacterium]
MRWDRYGPSRPRRVEGGIQARSRSGEIGATWWSRRWLEVLDSFGWADRLHRGRSYARRGQVLDFRIGPGRASARVQGSRRRPYRVEIALLRLSPAQWRVVCAAMASRAAFAARLLSGEVPPEAEEVFRAADAPLFPGSRRDFEARCSCPDRVGICKHVAAVHYLLAEQFDRDPFMLFALRGRGREALLRSLRKARGGEVAPDPEAGAEVPEPMTVERFWAIGPSFSRARAVPSPPAVDLAVLRRLGPPRFSPGRPDRLRRLEALYRQASARALEGSPE